MVRKSKSKWIRSLISVGLVLALLSSMIQVTWATPDGYSNENEVYDMAQSIWLVKDGIENATIILSSSATDGEREAAAVLNDYIQKISGAVLPVANSTEGTSGIKIYIGAATDLSLEAIEVSGGELESFRLNVTEDAIHLLGLTDTGTQYAVYELLEQLGVRWITPGEIGTVIPKLTNINVEIQDTIQHPGYKGRFLQAVTNYASYRTIPMVYESTEAVGWAKLNRLNAKSYGSHGFPGKETYLTKPEWCYVENGKPTIQFDVSKPEVLEYTVAECLKILEKDPDLEYINISPNDGDGFGGKIEGWDADDYDPMGGLLSITDRYVKFYNLVLEELTAKGYDKVRIAFYAYHIYIRPPVREIPNPRLIAVLAPITMDRIHSAGNPLSWERNFFRDIIKGWVDLGVQVTYRGYMFNLAEPGLPFSLVPQIASEFRYYHDIGLEYARVEATPAWAYHGPGLYLAAKMLWNPELDVKATMDDYYEKFYGPAADEMKAHFKLLEDVFEKADYYAGSLYDFHEILSAEVMAEMEAHLELAEQIAKSHSDAVYAKRVDMIRTSFDFGDNFLKMLDDNYKYEFESAKAKLDKVNELSLKSIEHSPVLLYPLSQYYIRRFFGERIMDGYQRVINGNKILATMPNGWRLMLDPKGGGEELGLWERGLGINSWRPIEIAPKTWSAQGLRYYNGDAWYRNSVEIPESTTDKDIRLWIGGIDENAEVWVNGVKLPILKSGKAIEKSWEFDATDAIEFGKENIVVVKVENRLVNELGMGGIVGPVMFWEVNKEPDITPSGPVQNFTAEAISDRKIEMKWETTEDDSEIAGYYVYVKNGRLAAILGPEARSYTTAERMMDKSYACYVKAIDIYGNINDKYDAAIDTIVTVNPSEKGGESIPPTKPEVIGFEAVSDSAVKITFKASTDNVGVVRYEITDNKTPANIYGNFVLAPEDMVKSELEYIVTGLKPNTTYKFFVTAYDAAGNSNKSADKGTILTLPDMTPPTAPTEFSGAVTSDRAVKLSWTASTDNVGVTGYNIYRDGNLIAGNIIATEYTDNNDLVVGSTYIYTVRAIDKLLNLSEASNSVTITITAQTVAMEPPTALTKGSVSDTEITINWTASISDGVMGYEVYQDGTKITDSIVNDITYTVTGLQPETEYTFTVIAVGADEKKSVESSALKVKTIAAPVTLADPKNVRGGALDNVSVKLIWDISDGTEVVGYSVYQGNKKIANVDKMVTEYIVTDLGDNRLPETTDMKEYSFIVKSVDSKGTESDGVEVKVQVGVRAEVVDSTSIKVIWAHRINAEKYRIKQKIDNGGWTIITGEFTDTEYVVSGLEGGKKYQFMVFPFVDSKWVVDNPLRLGMSTAVTLNQ